MRKKIMYLRKSQMDRDFEAVSVEETLKRHEKILNEFCQRNKIQIDVVLKEVVSGESLSGRPRMLELLELVNTGDFDGVVCMDIDRLSRGSSMDSGYITQVLQINDCKIITPSKTYDLDNDSDEQFTDLKFMFSRYELKTITNRLVNGRNSSASEGKFLGSIAPYGYEIYKLKGIKGNSLRIIPEQAEVVRMIFDMYTEKGMGYNTIKYELNAMHVPSINGKWGQTSISNIINNPVYIGKIPWKRAYTKKVMVDGKVVKTRQRSQEFYVFDGLHEPIITEEQWEKARVIQNTKSNPTVKYGRELLNPFAGLVTCGKCGSGMRRNSPSKKNKGTKPWYYCKNKDCDGKTIKCDDVEKAVVEEMKAWLHNYIIELEASEPKDKNNHKTALEMVQKKLEELIKQQDHICELMEAGAYSLELFNRRNSAIEADIQKFKKDEADLLKKIGQEETAESMVNNLIPTAQGLLDNYDDLTVREKNDIWKLILGKITVYRSQADEIDIQIYPKLPKV